VRPSFARVTTKLIFGVMMGCIFCGQKVRYTPYLREMQVYLPDTTDAKWPEWFGAVPRACAAHAVFHWRSRFSTIGPLRAGISELPGFGTVC
jgi:hypothetical protein